MHLYIAGKIGEEVISEATRKKFLKVKHRLEEMGHRVFDPTDPWWQTNLNNCYETDRWCNTWINETIKKYDYILLRDLAVIATVDAVFMMKDHNESPGASVEEEYARVIKKPLFYENSSFDMAKLSKLK